MAHTLSCTQERTPQPQLDIADVFRAHAQAYRDGHATTPEQARAIGAIGLCRTASLGGHVERCHSCGFSSQAYNSCRNRHCPKCQGAAQRAWVERHVLRILPVHYFHVVFTLPAQLRPLVHHNRRRLFDLLFKASQAALFELAADRLGATLGTTAVLHTWTRDLSFHPHIHTIVTGGGLAADGSGWVRARENYLFPHKALSRLFRGKFLAGLARLYRRRELSLRGDSELLADPELFRTFKDRLYSKDWNVYQKPPFAGPQDVYRYLGRYTHRIAISNYRILAIDETSVRFKTKHGKTATLGSREFIRRFLLHVLPKGFVKIRHHGLLAAVSKTKLEQARTALAPAARAAPGPSTQTALDGSRSDDVRNAAAATPMSGPRRCPACLIGTLIRQPLPAPVREGPRPPPLSPTAS